MHNFDQEIDEETFEVLATQYQEIIIQQMADETNAKNATELRNIRIAGLKAMMRATFLTNPLATEADFERLWPRMFDDALVEYTQTTQYEVMEQIVENVDGDDDDEDDEFDDDDEDDDDELEDDQKTPF
jgi:hypothetical protein